MPRIETIGDATLYHFAVGRNDDADALVRSDHYSARPPANVQVVGTWHEDGGLFGDRGPAVAACYFSIPPTRWSEPVLELSRLVRVPRASAPISGLIAKTVNHVKFTGSADLVVSFADWTQGHHGGVYQAAGWSYAGRRERQMDGVLLDGTFIPGRSCNSRWGTRSPDKLRAILSGHDVEPHYDAGKHLYWRALNRHGAKQALRLKLPTLPFPKPDYANRPVDEQGAPLCEPEASSGVRSNIQDAA